MKDFLRSPASWTLGIGIAIGALSVASVVRGGSFSKAYAEPMVEVRPVASITRSEALANLRALDESFSALADMAAPAVVDIKSNTTNGRDMLGNRMQMGGEGSGLIFRPDGYIITNDHVVGGFEKVTVHLQDGREFEGKVLRAEDSDIAVVKIEAKDLPTLPFADSNRVKVGQLVMAMGSPFGLESSASFGHVSALNRVNQIPDARLGRQRVYPDLIQTDAPINMGNSGGPLINTNGEVVGINTSIFSGTGGSIGIGFAIPSNQARLIAETLIEKGKIVRGYLGILPRNLKEIEKKQLGMTSGAFVEDAPSDGPSAIAGVRKGDVVVRIGNQAVANQMDVRNAMLKYAPGSSVPVEVLRDGQRKTFEVKITTPPPPERLVPQGMQMPRGFEFPQMPDLRAPESAVPRLGKARLGVSVQDIDATARKQFHIPASVNGAVVTSVEPESVAQKLGLKPGDVILAVDGSKVDGVQKLASLMAEVNWGDTRKITVGRYGEGTAVEQERVVVFR